MQAEPLFKLNPLPFEEHSLEPYFSPETLKYHHGRHQKGYVERLNQWIRETPEAHGQHLSLERIMVENPFEQEGMVNQAAQIWNHEFLWGGLAPTNQGGNPSCLSPYLQAGDWSCIEDFKTAVKKAALGHFGSGWLWLSGASTSVKLQLESLPNAGNPMMKGRVPLWTIDLWEHAHYIDFRNDRAAYFEAVWQMTHWEALAQRLAQYVASSLDA